MENFENAKAAEVVQDSNLYMVDWMKELHPAGLLPPNERKAAQEEKLELEEKLEFDYVPQGRRMVLVSVRLPDGGKLTRTTEPLSGTDGRDGFRVLKGYTLPNGVLMPKEIFRNSDGSISLRDVDPENRRPDRPVQRMSPAEFIRYIKDYKDE